MPGARRWILPSRATDAPLQRLLERRRQESLRLVSLERQFLPLLLSALLPILLLPMTAQPGWLGLFLLALSFTLLILQSIRTLPVASPSRSFLAQVLVFRGLGLISILGLWITVALGHWPDGSFRVLEMVLLSLFTLISSIRLVRILARVPRVNAQVMAGAAAGYLHLGITGGVLATATQLLVPGSFSLGSAANHQLLIDRLTYFSFVTIAGVGYGDVLPGNAVGERFVILLSVASTLYVALLVGLLLGRFIASEELDILEGEEAAGDDPDAP